MILIFAHKGVIKVSMVIKSSCSQTLLRLGDSDMPHGTSTFRWNVFQIAKIQRKFVLLIEGFAVQMLKFLNFECIHVMILFQAERKCGVVKTIYHRLCENQAFDFRH